MKNFRNRMSNRVKVRTMIRKPSQALSQFELYKLVAEQQRIRQELETMQKRVHQLQHCLNIVDNQIETAEDNIRKMRQTDSQTQKQSQEPTIIQSHDVVEDLNSFQTIYLDY
ncbi:gas vesicle protein [Aetokthonos hydrillicola Thurmond2011]|jgi:chromosome segregation ATPase|uniref:Gas vesicle protein n=1 Tax=Aetokthonos hydrillicola Thurmond2011 TaxID=2712845 RepID=A0AAP5M6K5_9CYAN|nr:gas vesicle protein [Aetokthonos hydrillicola]MBO3457737.1 gas vesicle protein [Aetokthonos hydrillicola CCALA 1050]MBW4589412.1 gas vesicle protein [Aetokthonos hydrillicola CCALA 1050]MDR9897111.1 gas vesicle protein [Aetokthonos hydrillicola Thurmond2011]